MTVRPVSSDDLLKAALDLSEDVARLEAALKEVLVEARATVAEAEAGRRWIEQAKLDSRPH